MPQINKFVVMAVAASALLAGCHKNHTVFALTNNGQLVQFNTDSPGTITASTTVSAIATPSNSSAGIVQMAYNPVNEEVYCITADGYLCTLDTGSGTATVVGSAPFTEILGNGGNSVTLSNPSMSFDPTTKAFRVVDGTYNLVVNYADGSLAESKPTLAYDSGDTNKNSTPNLAGIAYDNPLANASSTTLYALDSATHSLARIGDSNVSGPDSADTGVMHTIGATGIAFTADGGFAIDPSSGDAYAVLQPSGSSPVLYSVDLDSGAVSSDGTLGTINNDGSTLTIESLVISP